MPKNILKSLPYLLMYQVSLEIFFNYCNSMFLSHFTMYQHSLYSVCSLQHMLFLSNSNKATNENNTPIILPINITHSDPGKLERACRKTWPFDLF